MEKKKLFQSISKGHKFKEEPLIASVFMKNKGDHSSSRLFELYENCIVYYQTTEKKELSNKIPFDFDLIIELIRGSNQEQSKRRIGTPYGLKFQKDQESFCIYSDSLQTLIEWRKVLGTKLNQRGFHQLFKPIKKIGKGNFASVYLAIRLQDDRKFAIKAFSKQATYSEDKGKQSLINQIQLMRKFNNNNLMRLFQVYESQNSIYISVELLEGGQLYDKIKAKHKFTSQQINTILKGLLLGLQHMHAKRIMHRDLKPQNILLRKQNDYDCVIADFGLATWADEPEYLFVRCGTPGYVAPEIVNIKDMKAKCDPICDIFSAGVIFHILLTGKSPFPGKTYNQVLAQNRACNINFQTEDHNKLSPIALDILKKMLQKIPKARITATEALKHPYFAQQVKIPSNKSTSEQIMQVQNFSGNMKNPINKTSIMKNTSLLSNSGCDSPLMTSSNPLRRNVNGALLKDDSCLKFKMKQTIMTGKTDTYQSHDAIDSPNLKKNMTGLPLKESRFGQQKKMLDKRDVNREQ